MIGIANSWNRMVQHVANAVLYMDSLPLEANVQFVTVIATKMPYVGRGRTMIEPTPYSEEDIWRAWLV
jgi:hypothetical protein